MKLIKEENNIIILDNELGKKLIIYVDVDKSLDFHMSLKTSKKLDEKSSTFFEIGDTDKNDIDAQNIYFATVKLFQNLLGTFNKSKIFYKNRFSDIPIYNEKNECFNIHNDEGKIDKLDYIRFFRKNGKYYFFFNQKSKRFNLSNQKTRYKEFSKYFNEFYSNLYKECISKDMSKDSKIYTTTTPKIKCNKYGDK